MSKISSCLGAFQAHLDTKLVVMSPSETADWTRHLAKPGQALEGEVLCVLHKTVDDDDWRIRTRPCVRIVQVRNGRPMVVPFTDLRGEDMRSALALGAISLGRRKALTSFRYIATRYNGNRMFRREIRNAVHCVLPGAVITFQDPVGDALHYRYSQPVGGARHHSPLIDPPGEKIAWDLAVNPARSRHETLTQVATIENAWTRFREIWTAIRPEQGHTEIGEPPLPDLSWPAA